MLCAICDYNKPEDLSSSNIFCVTVLLVFTSTEVSINQKKLRYLDRFHVCIHVLCRECVTLPQVNWHMMMSIFFV